MTPLEMSQSKPGDVFRYKTPHDSCAFHYIAALTPQGEVRYVNLKSGHFYSARDMEVCNFQWLTKVSASIKVTERFVTECTTEVRSK